MARFVDLVAVEGPDKGMRYSVEEGTYRVLARAADDSHSTLQMTPEGDRALDKEAQARVDELFGRANNGQGADSDTPRASRSRTGFRKRGPDIVLKDGSVSRTHALVFVDKEIVSVADLMSTNGTKVNGAIVADVDLKEGDVIHVGKTKLKMEEG
jgi:pSer/pThr/pTyr-binding forkhead associated (FHA) protein